MEPVTSDDPRRAALLRRPIQVAGLNPAQAKRALAEVLDALDETVDAFVAERHAELQREGRDNRAIYPQIQRERSAWRFRSPALTLRQIRRRVYD